MFSWLEVFAGNVGFGVHKQFSLYPETLPWAWELHPIGVR
jgi:hypothetical protein